MKRFLLLIISLMMLTLPVSADGYVADNADVISEATEAQIKRTNDALANKNGASIHIYTAETCDGDIADFARGLFASYELDERAVLLCVFSDDYYLVRESVDEIIDKIRQYNAKVMDIHREITIVDRR